MATRGVVPPKQQRSRETFERILDGCEQLLRTRRFDEVSINDLCIEADVSASSLYGRFESKEAIILALSERHRHLTEESVQRAVEQVRTATAHERDLGAAAREIMTRYLAWFRANEHIEGAINLDAAAKSQVRASEELVVRAAAGLVADTLDPADGGLAQRIEFAIRVVSSAIQRAVAEPVAWARRMNLDDEQLIDELVAMSSHYLAATSSSTASPNPPRAADLR